MAEVGSAWVTLVPTAKGFGPAVSRQIGDDIGRVGDAQGKKMGGRMGGALGATLGKVGGPLIAAFGAAAAVGFAKDSIKSASDLSESINAVRVSYGKAGEDILKIGKTAATGFGLSKSEFNGFAVQFQSFSKTIAGADGDVSKTFSSILGRATDFASVMNLDVKEAATLFQSGLAGETEPLRKFGIDLSAAAVEAFAYSEGIASSGAELTEAQKVQARYGLLMKQTSKTQGDFKNTSGGLANQQRILTAQWKDFKSTLGAGLLPVVTKVFVGLNKGIKFLPKFGDELRSVTGLFSAGDGAKVGGFFDKLLGNKDVIAAFEQLKAYVSSAFASIVSIVQSVVTIVTALWARFGSTLLSTLTGVFGGVLNVLSGAFSVIQGLFNVIAGILTGDWSRVWDGIVQVLSGAWRIIVGIVKVGWALVKGLFSIAGKAIWAVVTGIFSGAVSLVGKGITGVINAVKSAPGKLRALGSAFLSAGGFIIEKFLSGLSKAGGFVADFAKGVWEALKKLINAGIDNINARLDFTIPMPAPFKDVPVNVKNIPHLAAGGIVSRPTLAVIGEAGPEAVVPLSGSHGKRAAAAGWGGGDRPIVMNGSIVGVLKEIASGEAELVFNKNLAFADAMGRTRR